MKKNLIGIVYCLVVMSNVAFGQEVRVISFDFSQDPQALGWKVAGQSELFSWDAVRGRLEVTWDSRLPNSYFYYPVGFELNRYDSFSVGLDLWLDELIPGIDPAKASAPFEIALGFIRVADATSPSFIRGTGINSPNLVEFDFFPDPGGEWIYGPSLMLIVYSTNSLSYSQGGFYPGELRTNVLYQIEMTYNGQLGTLGATIYTNGQVWLVMPEAILPATFTDFRVDAFAVCSYNDQGQWPGYEGSIYARGWLDNVVLVLPPPPVEEINGRFVDGAWEISFASRTNWVYTLERTVDLTQWQVIGTPVLGTGERLVLVDPNPPRDQAFYRVRAAKP